MHPSNLHFFPLALPFVLGLFLLMGLLMALIEVGILKYAYTKIGIDPRYVFLVLLLSLVGSYVNIPVAHLPGEQVITGRTITYFGMRYIIPMVQEWPGTVIAVNLGGAVIPTLLSLYLLCNIVYMCQVSWESCSSLPWSTGWRRRCRGWALPCRRSSHPWWQPLQPGCSNDAPRLPWPISPAAWGP